MANKFDTQERQRGEGGERNRERPPRPEPMSGQSTAPKMYPNLPCYSNLLWLADYEIRSGFSDESRHTTGTSGADYAWKEGYPESVELPDDYFE